MGWTEERVEMLKTLWKEGLSASQIAAKIGGISRNAVIGKIHRLGLSVRPVAPKQQAAIQRKKSGAQKQTTPAPTPSAPVANHECTPLMISPASLHENMCKWPIGDPGQPEFAFCGQPKLPGVSYCDAHARMAFQPLRKRTSRNSHAITENSDDAPNQKLAG